ncbi:MAG: M20/M25/M40 family metallo-hydrolase [Flavobacteriales bacterium]
MPYRSLYPGVMHACGHDAHTAMVLAAGRVLHALRAEWSGTVLLLFQPGEEQILAAPRWCCRRTRCAIQPRHRSSGST